MDYVVAVIDPPLKVVDLETAKAHLRVDFDDDDALIQGYVEAATGMLDGPDGWLGRSLGAQTLRLTLRGFPVGPFVLPLAPVTDVLSVKYQDAFSGELTIDPALYALSAAGALELAYGAQWPTLVDPAAPVIVEYQAGYETLPPRIRSAILIMTADLYANRETGGVGSVSFAYKMPTSVEGLVENYRVWRS